MQKLCIAVFQRHSKSCIENMWIYRSKTIVSREKKTSTPYKKEYLRHLFVCVCVHICFQIVFMWFVTKSMASKTQILYLTNCLLPIIYLFSAWSFFCLSVTCKLKLIIFLWMCAHKPFHLNRNQINEPCSLFILAAPADWYLLFFMYLSLSVCRIISPICIVFRWKSKFHQINTHEITLNELQLKQKKMQQQQISPTIRYYKRVKSNEK